MHAFCQLPRLSSMALYAYALRLYTLVKALGMPIAKSVYPQWRRIHKLRVQSNATIWTIIQRSLRTRAQVLVARP